MRTRTSSTAEMPSLAARRDRVARRDDDPAVLELFEIEITTEPLGEEAFDCMSKLPPTIRDCMEDLYNLVHDKPRKAIPRLEELIEEYPETPVLYNYLAVCYSSIGKHDHAEQIAEQNYKMNPDYLFARCNWAHILLDRGEVSKVPEVFGNTWNLRRMYPHRERFHITEYAAFQSAAIAYQFETGNEETALRGLEMLEEIAPDHPAIEPLRRRAMLTIVDRGMQRISNERTATKRQSQKRKGAKKQRKKKHR